MITSRSEYGGLPEAVTGRIPKIVFINSDGGCDHNFEHLQVLCSIIALHRFLDISLITVILRCLKTSFKNNFIWNERNLFKISFNLIGKLFPPILPCR